MTNDSSAGTTTSSVRFSGGWRRSIAEARWLWKTRNESPSRRSTLAGWTRLVVPRIDPDPAVGDELEDRPVGENGGRGVRHRGASVSVRAAVVPRQLLLWPPVPP